MSGTASTWFFDNVEPTALAQDESSVALVERRVGGGRMAPLYRREEDESYRVLEGEVTFFVDGDTVVARAGDVVVAPAGSKRTFRVESQEARWLVLTRVASLPRFEDFGKATAMEGEECWPSRDELAALRAIAGANGIEILGLPGRLPVPA